MPLLQNTIKTCLPCLRGALLPVDISKVKRFSIIANANNKNIIIYYKILFRLLSTLKTHTLAPINYKLYE